jgi:hypothetical protein
MNVQDDLDLLKKQLEVNDKRLKKLEEHKKSIEPELKNPKSKKDYERLLETMKRLDRNLQIEYKQRDGITKAMNSKAQF